MERHVSGSVLRFTLGAQVHLNKRQPPASANSLLRIYMQPSDNSITVICHIGPRSSLAL